MPCFVGLHIGEKAKGMGFDFFPLEVVCWEIEPLSRGFLHLRNPTKCSFYKPRDQFAGRVIRSLGRPTLAPAIGRPQCGRPVDKSVENFSCRSIDRARSVWYNKHGRYTDGITPWVLSAPPLLVLGRASVLMERMRNSRNRYLSSSGFSLF